jgi:2-keto-4-pentenoate hydratase/2-oxohepta-3-ene-1,7-dioic acid hydratase in catechol pathway
MRIVRFLDPEGQEHFGMDQNSKIGDSVTILHGNIFTDLKPTGQSATLSKLLTPITPCNIYCIGLNYREHAAESGMEEPDRPIVFAKPTSSLCHPGDPIRLPACQHEEEVDYECELAVIIGTEARDVSVDNALDFILGYTCANDVSARKWQLNAGGGQWIRGKGFDTFCPLGPSLVTKDEIPDPQELSIKTHLNGQTVQDHTTGDMIFSVAEIISFLSQDTTLLPGTAILTGTPQGVGFARKPPIWLRPGDEVTIELENIGTLTNPVIAAN